MKVTSFGEMVSLYYVLGWGILELAAFLFTSLGVGD